MYFCRDRPAAIPVQIKSIDDTSNFEDFPDVDLKMRKLLLFIYFFFFWNKRQKCKAIYSNIIFIGMT